MKKYEEPMFKIIFFETVDCLNASDAGSSDGAIDWTGGDIELPPTWFS